MADSKESDQESFEFIIMKLFSYKQYEIKKDLRELNFISDGKL